MSFPWDSNSKTVRVSCSFTFLQETRCNSEMKRESYLHRRRVLGAQLLLPFPFPSLPSFLIPPLFLSLSLFCVRLMHTVFVHVYSCSSLLCTFCFCRVYVSGISSCPVHPVFFSLNKSVQFSSVQYNCCTRLPSYYSQPKSVGLVWGLAATRRSV